MVGMLGWYDSMIMGMEVIISLFCYGAVKYLGEVQLSRALFTSNTFKGAAYVIANKRPELRAGFASLSF